MSRLCSTMPTIDLSSSVITGGRKTRIDDFSFPLRRAPSAIPVTGAHLALLASLEALSINVL